MAKSNAGDPGNERAPKPQKRDWVLLPLLCVLTICIALVATELIARRMFSAKAISLRTCIDFSHPEIGAKAIPNTVCAEKRPESPVLAEYRFNSCGHRAGFECGPKSPGTFRIVMAGSSVAMGSAIPRDETFAALLPVELSRRTGNKVELYNEGMGYGFPPRAVSLYFKDVLAQNPDLILWILTPKDFQEESFVPDKIPPQTPKASGLARYVAKIRGGIKSVFANGTPLKALASIWDQSRTALMLRHFLYESQSIYVKSYLIGGESTEFLRSSSTPDWQNHLEQFDRYAANIEGLANAAHVPVVAVLIPNRVQATMISMGEWPAGLDPYKLDKDLRTIVVSHGGTYIDMLPEFSKIPGSGKYYFPVDGHPNAQGHALISALLSKELTSGVVPRLNAQTQALLDYRR